MNIQNQIAFIRADTATTDSQFKSFIENQPKESIISEGKIVTVNENGVIKSKLIPEVIRIRNLAWELPPGRAVEVPKIVADEHRIRQKTKAEQEERQKLLRVTGLDEGKEHSQVAKEWQSISNKYNAPTEAMPYSED
ncbi:MAG: hypothetical protein DDT31_01042 [Syntrophomonadaceae bacterium]|nr:hypothetical protein [Bacillota bacterium]